MHDDDVSIATIAMETNIYVCVCVCVLNQLR